MPRVLFVPASGTWSFDTTTALPVTWTLPAAAKAGTVYLTASTVGSTPINGTGVIFTVTIDGVLAYTSACMENGSDSFPIPANTTTVTVAKTSGCHGGSDVTSGSSSAVSDP